MNKRKILKLALKLLSIIISLIMVFRFITSHINQSDVAAISSHDDPLGTLIPSVTHSAWTNQPIYQYLGMRYAEAPSGYRRFKPPVSVLLGPGEHVVAKHGRPCPVLAYLQNATEEELNGDIEDCLHLSVYTKNLNAKSAVMFYVHSGAFESGSSRFSPPNYLLEKDIVLVVPEFRLGPFGFLSTQTEQIPGNAALLDIILALNWTQTFISRFGGDPQRVTIFGQSSGAAMISALMLSPIVPENLFHRVILQSGSALSTRAFDFNPVASAKSIAKIAGCSWTDSVNRVNSCLLKIKPIRILEAYHKHFNENIPNGFTEYGGAKLTFSQLLPKSPNDLLRSNVMTRNISLMGGVTKHDGAYILSMVYKELGEPDLNSTRYLYIDEFLKFLGINDYSGATTGIFTNTLFNHQLLYSDNLDELTLGLMDLAGDVTIKAPLFTLLQAQSEVYPKQTYLYTFDYKGEFSYSPNAPHWPYPNGIHHADDLIYLFPYPQTVIHLNNKDKWMAAHMIDLWTSFAETGIPSSKVMPKWPAKTKPLGPYFRINTNCEIGENFLDQYTIAVDEFQAEEAARKAAEKEAAKHKADQANFDSVLVTFNGASHTKYLTLTFKVLVLSWLCLVF